MLKIVLATVFWLGLSFAALAQNPADMAQNQINKAIETRKKTQVNEDTWAEDKVRLQARFKALQDEKARLEKAVTDLEAAVTRDKDNIAAMKAEMVTIERISAELFPYLEDLLEAIDQQIDRDLPYLKAERHQRVRAAHESLNDQNVSIGQKFQRVMGVLMAEVEHGNSVDVGPKKIYLEKQQVLVDVLRLGRLSLFCQTPDRRTAGYFNPAQNAWQPLPPRYNAAIHAAIEIASKQRSAELLTLPLGKVIPQ